MAGSSQSEIRKLNFQLSLNRRNNCNTIAFNNQERIKMDTFNQKTKAISSISLAVVSSLLPFVCCWGPSVFAGVAVLSGFAGNFAFLHAYEPWLYGISFLSLGYSFYRLYIRQPKSSDGCEQCVTAAIAISNRLPKIFFWTATAILTGSFILNTFPEIVRN